ncbi:MAG: RNA polymerase-associated protein RapA [Opitutaceae bacterium]
MQLDAVGQRCVSEREPELGLGLVACLDAAHITVEFPASSEKRIYARNTPVLKRVQLRVGETVTTRRGDRFVVEAIATENSLLVYSGAGQRLREDQLSDRAAATLPTARLLGGQGDESALFDLRLRALQAQAAIRQSPLRGFLGGRIDLIPHQLYILHEVASRPVPRVLLADEVGLGKTIEACLIVQRLLAVGRAQRVLVLVPESLVHQWFVELLRRFNLWFSILDEERCAAAEASEPDGNPFLGQQLALCSTAFLAGGAARGDQAVAAGWDVVVVDEAHHLAWSPESASAGYAFVERLARQAPGLILLTATPNQLGQQGHFARLRLLDPDRYGSFEAYLAETERYAEVATVAERLLEAKALSARDRATLTRLFARVPEMLANRLAALDAGASGAREELLRTLVDQHGPGRVMFRNTRSAMSGFPQRKFCPVPLEGGDATLLARVARELEAEETGHEADIRHSFKDDPRLEWLAGFLRQHRTAKVLLICRSQRKVAAIAAALQERINVKTGLFHEGLPLVQRDRQAAWFAEPDGARILLCSEIGSEGRNFQFAHHLVLWDLPLNPGLVEQRIGRLDRIGQKQTIHVHVPYLVGSADECIVEWYHRGLDAFSAPLHGGAEFETRFRAPLLNLAGKAVIEPDKYREAVDALIAETATFRRELLARLHRGRDRLLELASFNRDIAGELVDQLRAADSDLPLRRLLPDLLDHFGVRITDHELGDLFLDPSHAFVEAFPGIPTEGTLITFDRARALAREDIPFVTRDHPLVRDTLDLLLHSPTGTAAFALVPAEKPALVLEAIFVLETVAETRWHSDQFLPPTPLRIVVDLRGDDITTAHPAGPLHDDTPEHALRRFLEQPHFSADLLKTMTDSATALAEQPAAQLRRGARERAAAVLGAELQRLVELQRVNDHVRDEEIALAREHLAQIDTVIAQARVRLDAVRLIVEGGEVRRRR